MMIQVSKMQWIAADAVEIVKAEICGREASRDLFAVWAILKTGEKIQLAVDLTEEEAEEACDKWAEWIIRARRG